MYLNGKSNPKAKITDTLSILPLMSEAYGNTNYKLLQLCSLDSKGYQIISTRRIELIQESKLIASISLPIADEDVKNFSIKKIAETKKGFEVVINWGGGKNIYDVKFNFIFRDHQFYLDEVLTSKYGPDTDEATLLKKINPPISIDKFKIIDYLE